MSDGKTAAGGGGIGFVSLLQIVFITLKLCKVIDWSWWWVMSPFLISFSILMLILAVCGVVLLVLAVKHSKAKL